MKILIVNTFDRGGAANACLKLHAGLLKEGIDSKILLKEKQKETLHTYILKPQQIKKSRPQKIVRKFKNVLVSFGIIKKKTIAENTFLEGRDKRLEFFSFSDSSFDITASQLYQEADIINLHWVANFLDYKSFFKKNTKPVIWTLHDMNAFTGGEHYEETFLGIDELGFPKKREISAVEIKIAAGNLRKKKKALAQVNNLTIVTPSKWLAAEAAKSEVFKGKNILHIPYGMNPEKFYPKNKIKSREFFSIPTEKRVVLFVSDSLNKNRKGFIFLKRAFEFLDGEKYLLCAVGGMDDKFESGNKFMQLGTIKEEEHMCCAYSAADVFVIPSLMDNLPNTVLESIMCGTPVIGFPVGGIPEMITNGKTGLVTEEISVTSLYRTILQFFSSIQEFSREEIRKDAIKKYDSNIQVNRYISLFQSMMNRKDEN